MIKLLLAIALFLIIFLIGIVYLYQQSDTQLKDIDYQRTQLEKSITTQARTYGQLTAIAKNMSNEKNQYQILMKKFPLTSAMAILLADITKLGTSSGLKFIYFKPEPNKTFIYYAGVPVKISVVGHFHQLGNFLSGIANLPNSVVSVDEFTIKPASDNPELLSLEFTATLYHALPTSLEIT